MEKFRELFARRPVILAPMEDVSDAVFRALCRAQGADVCMTEFVRAENAVAGCHMAARKLTLPAGDAPTAIQIYGADPARLAEAAEIAERAQPAFLDVNCGCRGSRAVVPAPAGCAIPRRWWRWPAWWCSAYPCQ